MIQSWRMKLWNVGVFMGGLGLLIMAGLDVARYVDGKSQRIPRGRPAGTYEIDMDEEF